MTRRHLDRIRLRHYQVLHAYHCLTGAEHDRGALLAEVEELQAQQERLARLVRKLQQDGTSTIPVDEIARLVLGGD